jgi:hypothetical protein
MRRIGPHLLAIILLGCAGHTNTVVAGNEGAPGAKRFQVCAPNTVIALPAELDGTTGPLRKQIDAYLHFHDREVQWLDLSQSKQLWAKAVSAAKEKGAVEKTPVFFAEEADKLFDFDAIVMPSIFVHNTRATDGGAHWDGVRRQMDVVNAPVQRVGRAQSTLADGIATGGINGEVSVTSVHLLVFARAGERVFEGRGGFAFVHDIDMSQLYKKGRFQYQMRDLAGDIDALREAIAIAFDPYLTPPEE